MLKIVLCQDDSYYREIFRQNISKVLFDKIDVQFDCYTDGSELVKRLENGEEIIADFIFLDINMPILNGMNTARILRGNQVDANIVLVASSGKYVLQGYEVHAYDYLLKPVSAERLEELFNRYFREEAERENKYLLVERKAKAERIPLKYVRYFLSDRRKIKAVLEEPYETKEFYMKMCDLEERLKDIGFLRCHQSYLVNSRKILELNGADLVLIGKERVPVSKKYRGKLKGIIPRLYGRNINEGEQGGK